MDVKPPQMAQYQRYQNILIIFSKIVLILTVSMQEKTPKHTLYFLKSTKLNVAHRFKKCRIYDL